MGNYLSPIVHRLTEHSLCRDLINFGGEGFNPFLLLRYIFGKLKTKEISVDHLAEWALGGQGVLPVNP
jgi:hypothetical protein